jgi:hypothetical protein
VGKEGGKNRRRRTPFAATLFFFGEVGAASPPSPCGPLPLYCKRMSFDCCALFWPFFILFFSVAPVHLLVFLLFYHLFLPVRGIAFQLGPLGGLTRQKKKRKKLKP